ncbi:MAG: DNA-directed RNA polymerase subunit alpha [Deferribacterales bacterium]|jgi:DNA-directed RNA polymerase subunit alpha|uniref:DNA-directed RNA polymerase subunit alpha n=1 Tax=Deferrivibrio essentukiensis TaxID=2880922 RepID=UPI00199E7777|nr:DNA-directed RNA polymerase subunit alpha [Deferrivibrio essentukiensis]MBC7196378.1 DNA-directed RNA polymerase subunit alpha [Deferribacterales bacterium]MBZ4672544.1 DNA-directed polymerase subunit alpha [Deferribacteraceae bacterium]
MILMQFQNLIKPKKIEPVGELTRNYGKFVAEPLERGFGITIGNSLRRTLLSTIEGTAVVGVRIEGVTHEYATIPGVFEDVVDIILNIKSLELSLHTHDQVRVFIEKSGEGAITAADIKGNPNVEVLNPEQHIATITDPNTKIYMELIVERGIGYVPAEEMKDKFDEVDIIPIDAIFSPIKRVNYHVDNARVGQSTDYDKLILEVETDGSIKPEDAIAFAAKILKDQMELFINFDEPEYEDVEVKETKDNSEILDLLDKSIEELELSVRAYNCLKNANIKTLSELCSKTDSEMLKTKNFGRKSLEEIKKVLNDMGLSLGMDLEAIGYNKETEGEENDAS